MSASVSSMQVSSPKASGEERARSPGRRNPYPMPLVDRTHEVFNQPPPFEDVNMFEADLALREGLDREHAGWAVDRVRDCGAVAGSAEAQEHGRRAERN